MKTLNYGVKMTDEQLKQFLDLPTDPHGKALTIEEREFLLGEKDESSKN